jgi:hypothetical protein
MDGVVDSENYFASKFNLNVKLSVCLNFIYFTPFYIALWSNNLLDTDKTMESFYTGCADAGPERCAFWAPSSDDIRQNLTNLYNSLSVQPIPVKSGNTYGYVDYKMLHLLVFYSLYAPFANFRRLARGLADLAAGNGAIVLKEMTSSPFECSRDSKDLEQNSLEAMFAIQCIDGADVPADLHSAQKFSERMSNMSEFGNLWAGYHRVRCA